MLAWMVLMLQEAVARKPALPQTLGEWLSIIVQSLVIGGAVGGFIWRQAMTKVNGVGARVNANESDIAKLTGRADETDRKLQYAEFDRAKLHEDLGRLTGAVDRFVTTSDSRRERDSVRDEKILERLTRIEERSQVGEAIHELGEIVAKAIRGTKQ